ncbi:SGNH/GDSL hydrolase family protein [Candidatus Woesearchaeota archaeon]|nr:SGNH/GDSL hydrolase family protein [Candidatus Woesearchaeota archaeon]
MKTNQLVKKMLLLAITLLACAIVIEVFFRFYWPYKSIYVSDDELNYKPKPNFVGVYKSPEGQHEFWTNQEGFVNQNPKKEKPPGTKRIFIVGDSFVEGLYTEKENHFTALLQNRLNSYASQQSSARHEVISYGTSSWGTDNEYKYLITQALSYNPDVVVLTYYQNDLGNVAVSRLFRVENESILPTDVGGTMLGNGAKKLIIKCSFYSAFCSYFQLHATQFKLLNPIMARLGFSVATGAATATDFKKHPYVTDLAPDEKQAVEDAWNKTELLIRTMKAETEQRGAKLALAYIPARWEVGEKEYEDFLQAANLSTNRTNMQAIRERITDISARNGIMLIDPTDEFLKREAEGKTLYQSFVHFTKEGDKLFAEELYKGLANYSTQTAAVEDLRIKAKI